MAQISEVSLSCIRYRVTAKSARRIAMTIQILMRVIRAAMVPERKAPPKRGQGLSWKENQDEATATDTQIAAVLRRCRARRCAHITTGLFNMPGSADSNSGMRKEKNPAPRSLWWISLILVSLALDREVTLRFRLGPRRRQPASGAGVTCEPVGAG